MNLKYSKKEKRILRLAEETIKKWREILYIDPLWTIEIDVFEDEDYENFVIIDMSNSKYYLAVVKISYLILQMEEVDFLTKVDDIVSHELIHLVTMDFFRTAQVAAGGKKEIHKELEHKYEQFTTRLQTAFVNLYKKIPVDIKEQVEEVEK